MRSDARVAHTLVRRGPLFSLADIIFNSEIGLPAFKPGEKVEIDFSMDDF